MIKTIAQAPTSLGTFEGIGPLGLEGAEAETAGQVFNKIISGAIGLITIVGIIWFVITLITGAVGIMTAGSDKNALEGAKKRIVNGLIGLVILVAGIFIVGLIGRIFGISNILDPASFIETFFE